MATPALPAALGWLSGAPTWSSSLWICSVSSCTLGCRVFSSAHGGAENTSSFSGPLRGFHVGGSAASLQPPGGHLPVTPSLFPGAGAGHHSYEWRCLAPLRAMCPSPHRALGTLTP